MVTAEPATFDSAEHRPRELSPPDYWPMIAVNAELVYDDELDDLEPGPWRRFFNGGSNRLHFVRADADGNLYFVSQENSGYEYSAPDDGGYYANAYDAFYAADRQIPDAG